MAYNDPNDPNNVKINNAQHSQGYQQPPPGTPTGQGMSMGPMSPTFAPNNGGANLQQQLQQTLPPPPAGSVSIEAGAPGTAVGPTSGVAAPPPPQLIWAQRRILGSNPFPRFQHTNSVTSSGTDIFVYGGTQRGVPKDDLFVIDSASMQCQALSPGGVDRPMAKSAHTAVNIGQYIIYFGGWDPTTGQCDDSLHVLHTARKEWNKPAIQGPLPTRRHSHTACSVGTIMYVFGGQVDNFYLRDVVTFDMKSITQNPHWDVIESATESPPARSGHCAAVYDNKIYIFGGADADYFYNDIWCFDTRNNTWTPIPASGYLPSGRHGHSCVIVDGVLYIFGGSGPDGSELNDAYAFRIHERRWYLFQSSGPVPSPRNGHSMCTIKDKIFVIGGDAEQGLQDDPAMVYYLEVPKIRFPDSPIVNGPRQVSSAKLVPARPDGGSSQPPPPQMATEAPSDQDSERGVTGPPSSGRPDRPDRPARLDRPMTLRPSSPATFAAGTGNSGNISISQQTLQLMNPQLGHRPLTTLGAPPRGASAAANQGPGMDYQAEGLSIATRRQTMKDTIDNNDIYGGASIGVATPATSANANRRTMQHLPTSGPIAGVNGPSPHRGGGDMSPTVTRFDRRTMMNGVSPTAPINNRKEEEVNPYAMDVLAPAAASGSPYLSPMTAPAPASTVAAARQNLPPPPRSSSPSPPVSTKAAVGPTGPLPSQPTNRSPSPVATRAQARGAPAAPPPHLTAAAAGPDAVHVGTAVAPTPSPADAARLRELESKAKAAQEGYERLEQQLRERDQQLASLQKRENWLVAEVMLARQLTGTGSGQQREQSNDKRLSIADLLQQIEGRSLEGQQLTITKALLKVKEELRNTKMSVATQAQSASLKIKEAERIRTGALQEAAYLKAKLSSLANAQQDPDALGRVEMERAADLEKRLTTALGEMEALESQYVSSQESLQQEKLARLAAEDRSNGSSVLAEQAQAAHTRALAELASLHSRAAKAEAESREYAAQLAESQAGSSGHQSQSSGLLQKISDLKQQVEGQESAIERVQMAYSAAIDRATRAEALSDESSSKLEKLEDVRSQLASELSRHKGETERLQSKVEELDSRWQVSKDEVITLRKLVEDGLGAFNPRGKLPKMSAERKHDSIAILNTVSKVSELEHELSSLKVLHKQSQSSASTSAAELAAAMIELSQLEQSSMQAKAESISLQRLLAEEREGSVQLRNELSKAEQNLEIKIKELENHDVQLGLLKDVMREKGIIAEDLILQASARGSEDYAVSMAVKVKQAEDRVQALEQELEDTRENFAQQMEAFEAQRQATVQHSEKTGILLRKMKNDLSATIKEKDAVESELRQLQELHSRCSELSSTRDGQNKKQEDERVQMLQMHWDEERRELSTELGKIQSQLVDSEVHATQLSQKVISLTERVEEVETLNEAISEQLETMQEQAEAFKSKATIQEMQLKSDVERLVNEVHQAQDMIQIKQRELEGAFGLTEQLETQLNHALEAQAAAVTAAANASSSGAGAKSEAAAELANAIQQRQEIELRLKKAQEEIQILEGDNSVLEARLQDSEKKVALLLEDIQHSAIDASGPNSPFTSTNLTGVQQQSNQQFARNVGHSNAALNSALASQSPTQRVSSSGSNQRGNLGGSPAGTHLNKSSPSPSTHSANTYQYGAADEDEDDEDVDSRSYRDSVDSITRELEMLKVPWNKSGMKGAANTDSGRKSSSPLHRPYQATQSQQQQQQQQHQGAFYDNDMNINNTDLDAYGEEDDYADQGHGHSSSQHMSNNGQGNGTIDTRSFNDRSPSRLREYEQMIDEIESSRSHH
ncbi:Negative regulator of mitotic exit [Dissophora globulifera]|uniref:Negative regulator of mitotic exit n=1 Tax=Dissophora globulifera TaxID=979702 RepID=A0A9P6UZP7_9FUNG|nr:Negative regulator of mitotic exit [Dissophora globulifera]